MKDYEVVGVIHDGEFICPDCYTEEEDLVANDKMVSDTISVVFGESVGNGETCSRCGEPLCA